MKRSIGGFYGLIDRRYACLRWWQELILNWVASWENIAIVMVITNDGQQIEWDVPPDYERDRMELEEQWRN